MSYLTYIEILLYIGDAVLGQIAQVTRFKTNAKKVLTSGLWCVIILTN